MRRPTFHSQSLTNAIKNRTNKSNCNNYCEVHKIRLCRQRLPPSSQLTSQLCLLSLHIPLTRISTRHPATDAKKISSHPTAAVVELVDQKCRKISFMSVSQSVSQSVCVANKYFHCLTHTCILRKAMFYATTTTAQEH
jgi:hypothetical protein